MTTTFTLPRERMIAALDRISFCMSEDKEHPHICGALLEAVDGKIRFVATDGHRLGYAEVAVLDGLPPPKGATLPGSVVRMLIDRLPAQTDESVVVSVKTGSFSVKCGRLSVGDQLIVYPFPEYRDRVLAALGGEGFADVVFDANALWNIVDDATANMVTLDIQNDRMFVEGDDKPVSCTAPPGWTPRTLTINRHYLVDALSPFSNTSTATLRIGPALGPLSFEAASIPGLRHIVMPIGREGRDHG